MPRPGRSRCPVCRRGCGFRYTARPGVHTYMSSILRKDTARWRREIRETFVLATPLILGQLSSIGMNVIDTLLAGHLDAHTLAAVAVGTSLWSLAIVAAIGVMLALPPSVAQLAG